MTTELNSGLDIVRHYLTTYIRNHKLSRGDQLPSEAEMAKQIGVSRNTLREAYISLEADGIIVRRHGRGTFIAHTPIIEDNQSGFTSFPNRIRAAGYTPSFRKLSISHELPPPFVSEAVHASVSERLLCVERVLLADKTPTVFLRDYFSKTLDVNNLNWDTFTGDMMEFLSTNLSIEFSGSQVHTKFRAVLTDAEIASRLQLGEGMPIISLHATVFTFDNHPIVFTESYLNPSIIELDIVRVIRN